MQFWIGSGFIKLNVLPINRVKTTMTIANIMDNKPFMNIMYFAMCTSPAAAMGMMTPMP
jgi:hypothetical protein